MLHRDIHIRVFHNLHIRSYGAGVMPRWQIYLNATIIAVSLLSILINLMVMAQRGF
jgi:hypothetical protein